MNDIHICSNNELYNLECAHDIILLAANPGKFKVFFDLVSTIVGVIVIRRATLKCEISSRPGWFGVQPCSCRENLSEIDSFCHPGSCISPEWSYIK